MSLLGTALAQTRQTADRQDNRRAILDAINRAAALQAEKSPTRAPQ